ALSQPADECGRQPGRLPALTPRRWKSASTVAASPAIAAVTWMAPSPSGARRQGVGGGLCTRRTVTAGTHGRRYQALVTLACLRRRLP
ncbi:hypothetical protein ABT366_23135, partial [Streptomyces lydicus]|uniref:hypothetical protein n=1 Tax=Streptomyces lydicus TaxID=47763 RepID=UPI00333090EE